MSELSLPDQLRYIAQNDYMIDGHYLPTGRTLHEAAALIDKLELQYEGLEQDYADLVEQMSMIGEA